jgi:hypothetical protein
VNSYRFANGQIVKERGHPDLLGLIQQIGAVPAQAEDVLKCLPRSPGTGQAAGAIGRFVSYRYETITFGSSFPRLDKTAVPARTDRS